MGRDRRSPREGFNSLDFYSYHYIHLAALGEGRPPALVQVGDTQISSRLEVLRSLFSGESQPTIFCKFCRIF